MRRLLQTLYIKLHMGGRVPWDCVFLGHRLRPHPSGPDTYHGLDWYFCSRPGCTYEVGYPVTK